MVSIRCDATRVVSRVTRSSKMPEPTSEVVARMSRCLCGDTVTVHDDGHMCCGTDMFQDPRLPPLGSRSRPE